MSIIAAKPPNYKDHNMPLLISWGLKVKNVLLVKQKLYSFRLMSGKTTSKDSQEIIKQQKGSIYNQLQQHLQVMDFRVD